MKLDQFKSINIYQSRLEGVQLKYNSKELLPGINLTLNSVKEGHSVPNVAKTLCLAITHIYSCQLFGIFGNNKGKKWISYKSHNFKKWV